VRGYPVAQFSGDRGYSLTGEFRWNAPGFADKSAFLGKKWGDIFQCYAFIDHGGANLIIRRKGKRRARRLPARAWGRSSPFPTTSC